MSQYIDIESLNQQIAIESAFLDKLIANQSKIMVGQSHLMNSLLLGLLTKGHVLLEGLPGLAKTLAIKTLASSINAQFHRIQFTPDLLPADIIGTLVYNPGDHQFTVRKGPIFSNFILADEINRAPVKLEEPFLVLATQNPIEQEGTYPLPEAQVDRFMMKVIVNYPSMQEEMEIMRRNLSGEIHQEITPVIHQNDILKARESV